MTGACTEDNSLYGSVAGGGGNGGSGGSPDGGLDDGASCTTADPCKTASWSGTQCELLDQPDGTPCPGTPTQPCHAFECRAGVCQEVAPSCSSVRPVVLVHGINGSSTNFSTMIDRLIADGWTAEYLFPFDGALNGKFIGMSLKKEGTIGKRRVVHVQDVGNFLLRLGDAGAGEGAEAAIGSDLKLQNGLPCAGTALRSGVLPDNAIRLLTHGKIKFYLHLRFPQGNQVVVTFRSGFTPECPGHGINQRRFAVTVIARDTGGMHAVKGEWRHTVAVAHKVTQG